MTIPAGILGSQGSLFVGQSLNTIMTNLGYARTCILDAGDIASVPSALATQWLDVSGNANHFDIGADTTAPATDPVFIGTPGGLTNGGEYFENTGAASPLCMFEEPSTAMSFAENWHKDNAIFGMGALVWFPAVSLEDTIPIFSTSTDATSGIGVSWRITNFGGSYSMGFIIGKGSSPFAFSGLQSAIPIVPGAWNYLGVGIREASALGVLRINATEVPFTATYASPSASASSQPYRVMGKTSANGMAPGVRIMGFIASSGLSGVDLAAEQLALYNAIKLNRLPQLP